MLYDVTYLRMFIEHFGALRALEFSVVSVYMIIQCSLRAKSLGAALDSAVKLRYGLSPRLSTLRLSSLVLFLYFLCLCVWSVIFFEINWRLARVT